MRGRRRDARARWARITTSRRSVTRRPGAHCFRRTTPQRPERQESKARIEGACKVRTWPLKPWALRARQGLRRRRRPSARSACANIRVGSWLGEQPRRSERQLLGPACPKAAGPLSANSGREANVRGHRSHARKRTGRNPPCSRSLAIRRTAGRDPTQSFEPNSTRAISGHTTRSSRASRLPIPKPTRQRWLVSLPHSHQARVVLCSRRVVEIVLEQP